MWCKSQVSWSFDSVVCLWFKVDGSRVLLCAEISWVGEKYLDKEIENAINGVKEMKTVMEKSEEDHKKFLSTLEKTKKQKEVRDERHTVASGCFFWFILYYRLNIVFVIQL